MGHHNEQEPNNADNVNLQNLKAENSATVNISKTDGVGSFRFMIIGQLMALCVLFHRRFLECSTLYTCLRHPIKFCFNSIFIF